MKRTNRSVLPALTAAAMLLVACGKSAPKIDLVAEGKAVRDVSMHWLDLAKARDAAGEAGLFAADGIAYRLHHEPIVGPAAYQTFATEDYAKNPKAVVSWATSAVTVAASGDLAVETGTYHLTGGGPKGDVEDKGEYITIYKKINGTWKVAEDIGTSAMPEAPAKASAPAKAPAKKTPAKKPAPAKKK